MKTRPPLWTSADSALATKGTASGAWQAFGVSIDTRSLEPGDLFVALQGERDGHEFAAAAVEKHAAAVLIDRDPGNLPPGAPRLLVSDTQAALENLGRASRARTGARIVAVTGSAGKTTTKEMLRLMLSALGPVAASAASYNNHWGVPLSLARMARETKYGVFEIGMNHAGEIRALVRQAQPHVALITTVAPAHLEYFGHVEAIADAKAEIFEGLVPTGCAILPADNPQYERMRAHADKAGVARILAFGTAAGCEARLISAEPGGDGQNIVVQLGGERLVLHIGAPGMHIAMNAVAALLAVRELGADVTAAGEALTGFAPLKGRGARFRAGEIDVIDESYNANPASMAAALALLGEARVGSGGRRIAVLGDMLELGEESGRLHRALGENLAAAGSDLVFLCGTRMEMLWQVLPAGKRGAYAPSSVGLVGDLMRVLRSGDVVLVKGSFSSRMSVIIDALKAREAASA